MWSYFWQIPGKYCWIPPKKKGPCSRLDFEGKKDFQPVLMYWSSKNKAFSYISLAKQNNRTLLVLRFWGKKENFSPCCRIDLRRTKLFPHLTGKKMQELWLLPKTLLMLSFSWERKIFFEVLRQVKDCEVWKMKEIILLLIQKSLSFCYGLI